MSMFPWEAGFLGPDVVLAMPEIFHWGQKRASAKIAHLRLRDVVKRDRAAAPCARWTQVRESRWGHVMPPMHASVETMLRFARAMKPRYRWEVRR